MSTKNSSFVFRLFSVLVSLTLLASAPGVTPAHAAGTRYAKPSAIGTGDCSTWANACILQTALAGAASGDEIWVMAGTYKPTAGTDNTATFQLKNGVAVYGGFAGTETLRTERNPAVNLTILSGEIGAAGNDDNSYHVVTGDTGATLDGFTISAGNANGEFPDERGGGMYNSSGSLVLMDITFSDNSATDSGGGMYNGSGSPTITNVTFSGNTAKYGGGMHIVNSSPTLTNITFSGNTADYGGGIYKSSSNPILTNVTFSDNSATDSGGGIYNYGSSLTITNVAFSDNSADYGGGIYNYGNSPTITNVTFSDNSATKDGGGMHNSSSSPTITNVTFSSNTAIENGGGMYNSTSSPTLVNVTFSGNEAQYGGGMRNRYSNPTITNGTFIGNLATSDGGGIYNLSIDPQQTRNTIFWGNTAATGAQIFNSSISISSVSDSVVQDGCPVGSACVNIKITDPLLGVLGNYGGFTQTIPLYAGSSAIDSTDSNCPATDQRGMIRTYPTCDIGAYEVQSVLLAIPGGQGSGLCDSWANACELRYALASAVSGQEVWVAAGTYTSGALRTDTFQLKNGVAIYGGFAGTETACSQRNPATNVTALSGEIGLTGNTDNSYHVVTGATGATLDGFTITDGNADGASPNNRGGGIYNSSSSPTLVNLTLNSNTAISGGGMYNSSSNPTIMNITFSSNSADWGGGMYNSSSSPTLTNVTFSGNSTTGGGGGMYNSSSSPTITNITFSGNMATEPSGKGGGIYNAHGSNPQISNTIFWGNTASSEAQIYNNSGVPSVNYSVVQGGYADGTNIIITDPLLGTLGNYGGSTQTIPLPKGSSAIDTGSDATCATTDQRGVTRPQGAHCDIGAYETITIYKLFLPLILR